MFRAIQSRGSLHDSNFSQLLKARTIVRDLLPAGLRRYPHMNNYQMPWILVVHPVAFSPISIPTNLTNLESFLERMDQ